METEPKWYVRSRTILAAVVSIIIAVGDLALAEQIEALGSAVLEVVPSLLSIAGMVTAIWGRWVATQKISFSNPERTFKR